jgi:hypothetical protein
MNTQQTSDAESQAVILTAALKQKQGLSQDEIPKMQELLLQLQRLLPAERVRVEHVGKIIRNPM